MDKDLLRLLVETIIHGGQVAALDEFRRVEKVRLLLVAPLRLRSRAPECIGDFAIFRVVSRFVALRTHRLVLGAHKPLDEIRREQWLPLGGPLARQLHVRANDINMTFHILHELVKPSVLRECRFRCLRCCSVRLALSTRGLPLLAILLPLP